MDGKFERAIHSRENAPTAGEILQKLQPVLCTTEGFSKRGRQFVRHRAKKKELLKPEFILEYI